VASYAKDHLRLMVGQDFDGVIGGWANWACH